MKGFIVVADDLLFDNQPVAVGETITVTRHPKSEQNADIWVSRSFGVALDYAARQLWHSEWTHVPKYRIFEVEIHGPCIPENGYYRCKTFTVARECTPGTEFVPLSRRSQFAWWSMMYVDSSEGIERILTQLQPNINRALETRTSYGPYAVTIETERVFCIIRSVLHKFASQTTIAPSVSQLETVMNLIQQTQTYLQEVRGQEASRGLLKAFYGLVDGWYHNPAFHKSQVRKVCAEWLTVHGEPESASEYHLVMFWPLEQLVEALRTSYVQTSLLKHMQPYLSEADMIRIASDLPAIVVHCICHPMWEALGGGIILPKPVIPLLKEHPDIQFSDRYSSLWGIESVMGVIDNQLAFYHPTDPALLNTTNSLIYRVKQRHADALEEATRHKSEDVRILAAIYGGHPEHRILAKDKSIAVRTAVALHADEDIVHSLREDRSPTVRVAVASRGFDEDLDVLVNDDSPNVRKMVLSFVRPQDVEQLKNDSIRAIRVMADKATIVE